MRGRARSDDVHAAQRAQAASRSNQPHAVTVDLAVLADMQAEFGAVGFIDDERVGFEKARALLRCEGVSEQEPARRRIDARDDDADATAIRGAAPVPVEPLEALDVCGRRVHPRAQFRDVGDGPPELDALRTGKPDPEVRARRADIDARRRENAEHQRALHE